MDWAICMPNNFIVAEATNWSETLKYRLEISPDALDGNAYPIATKYERDSNQSWKLLMRQELIPKGQVLDF